MIKKIVTQKRLFAILKKLRRDNKKIVFTNGCFDLLHAGHIRYLNFAKNLGDVLIVGLNSDSSVSQIKGNKRPIMKQMDRAQILASLACVDFVTIFNQTTPAELIKRIRPDVLVKAGDWREDRIVGRDFVKTYGGKAVVAPYLKGHSTSLLIRNILKRYAAKKNR